MTDEERIDAYLSLVAEYTIELFTADRQKLTAPLYATTSDSAYDQFDAIFMTLHASKNLQAQGYDLGDLSQVRIMQLRSPEGNRMTSYRIHLREMDYRFRGLKG